MAKNNYIVPKSQQHFYKMAVQRANRRIKSNLKYITKNNIQDENALRSLVSGFYDQEKWATKSMPFSRSIKGRYIWDIDSEKQEFVEFKSEREFKQYMNFLNKWGKEGTGYETNPKRVKKSYEQAIIKALNQVKDHYNITLPGGKLPNEVVKMIKGLNIEELANFFGDRQVEEFVEVSHFSSDEFLDVTSPEDFIDVIKSRINQVQYYLEK